ncbi:MAG: iron-containing alcohol dehydrogenase [Candidatus Melainabacteria bacterium]|nr:iron-containing alcohol dehydrogenase [Candidatus Melainabacteria bacterium]
MRKYDIPESVIFFDTNTDLSARLIQILNNYGYKDPLFICGENSYRELGEKVFNQCKSVLNDSEIIIAPEINKELITNDLAQEYLKSQSPVVGIGGGRILDFAKYISFKTDRPFISIPSNAAHDGIFSPISVIAGFSLGSKMPDYLMISLNTLEKAPLISIQAGIGDLIANFTAINDCYISQAFKDKDENAEIGVRKQSNEGTVTERASSRLRRTNDRSVLQVHEDYEDDENAEIGVREQCQEAINLAYQGSIELIDLIYATQANDEIVTKIAEPGLELLHSPKFLRQFIRSLVLSGMAMYYANNSSPCSGSEHMISHAIDAIYGHGVKAAHGIQVAIASYFIYPQQLEVLKKINQTPERIINFEELFTLLKLPKSFQEIGVSSKELDYVLKLAPKTRANKFSILNLKDDRLKISN